MKRFWNEIHEHRIASGLFLAYWAAAFLLFALRWHAPRTTGDVIPPVMLLHVLLPVAAGFLAAWWRGPHPGRIAHGMLAGAVVTFADWFFVFAYSEMALSSGQSRDGILEYPVFLVIFSVVGAVLGCAGALGGAALGGRIPAASTTRPVLPRRNLVAAGALAFGAALLLVTAVIPPVRVGLAPTPDRAVHALAVIAVLNVCAGVGLLIATFARAGRASQAVSAAAGLLMIFLGAGLAPAGSAWAGDPGLGVAGAACLACALGDLTGGALALVAAFRQRKSIATQVR